MSSIVIAGDTSGAVTISAPAVAGSAVLTLPTTSGTLYATTGGGAIPVGSGGTGLTSAGATGNVLTSDGTAWTSATNAPAFASGTVLIFGQTTAPTGWTKDVSSTTNDSALRVITGTVGTGGTSAFSTVFTNQTPTFTGSIGTLAGGATTLSTAQIASHTHGYVTPAGAARFLVDDFGPNNTTTGGGSSTTDAQGGGGSHSHSISGAPGGTVGAVTLNTKYVDVIRATKN
jgi:hypothetical protein